jgi:acyl carrier protein
VAEADNVRAGVRRFILETFLVGEPPESLQDSTSLLTTGIISSLAMLDLVAFLENEYGVTFLQDDLSPDRLDSVDLIVRLVRELRQREAAGG